MEAAKPVSRRLAPHLKETCSKARVTWMEESPLEDMPIMLKQSRRGQIASFIAMDVMREANLAAAAGRDIVHLEVGQPATGAPKLVIEAARQALETHALGYTEALGLSPLRQRIARHYRETYGAAISPDQLVVTVGASGAFMLAFLGSFDVGDRVALVAPGYPAYRNILTALGLEPVIIDSGPDDRYQPTPALLDRVPGPLQGLIVASPSNPAGTMLTAAELATLAGYCEARGIRLISDEIYHGITYGPPAATAAACSSHAIIVNSFSKYYSMTGWRLGWLVLPPDLMRPAECLAQNLFISPPTISQIAALAAFDAGEELRGNLANYAANRDLLLRELPSLGFGNFVVPDGAFYIYADIGDLTDDATAFCQRLLADTGVAMTPGLDFDAMRGNRYIRISFAGAHADMVEAMARLRLWHNRRGA